MLKMLEDKDLNVPETHVNIHISDLLAPQSKCFRGNLHTASAV